MSWVQIIEYDALNRIHTIDIDETQLEIDGFVAVQVGDVGLPLASMQELHRATSLPVPRMSPNFIRSSALFALSWLPDMRTSSRTQ